MLFWVNLQESSNTHLWVSSSTLSSWHDFRFLRKIDRKNTANISSDLNFKVVRMFFFIYFFCAHNFPFPLEAVLIVLVVILWQKCHRNQHRNQNHKINSDNHIYISHTFDIRKTFTVWLCIKQVGFVAQSHSLYICLKLNFKCQQTLLLILSTHSMSSFSCLNETHSFVTLNDFTTFSDGMDTTHFKSNGTQRNSIDANIPHLKYTLE